MRNMSLIGLIDKNIFNMLMGIQHELHTVSGHK